MELKINSLFAEKYRPNNLDEFVGNKPIIDKFKLYIKEKDIPHLLLVGPQGCGKTSISKILAKTISPDDYLYINASDENNIETVRNKIKNFAISISMNSTIKIIILDECLDENTPVSVLRCGKEVLIKIKDLDDSGDLVKSFNIKKNRIEYMPFNLIDKGISDDCLEIELETGEIVICSKTHGWYIENETGEIIMVKASNLNKHMHIMT